MKNGMLSWLQRLREDQSDYNKQVGEFGDLSPEDRVELLARLLHNAHNDFNDHENDLDRMNEAIERLEEKVSALSETLGEVENRLDSHERMSGR
jgi:chromosome segregation ATPase